MFRFSSPLVVASPPSSLSHFLSNAESVHFIRSDSANFSWHPPFCQHNLPNFLSPLPLLDLSLQPGVHDARNRPEISDREKINKLHLNNLITWPLRLVNSSSEVSDRFLASWIQGFPPILPNSTTSSVKLLVELPPQGLYYFYHQSLNSCFGILFYSTTQDANHIYTRKL